MKGLQIDIIVPVWINSADIINSIRELLTNCETNGIVKVNARVVALQCTEEDRFSQEILTYDSTFEILYDKALVQSLLLNHEIVDVPCAVVTPLPDLSLGEINSRENANDTKIIQLQNKPILSLFDSAIVQTPDAVNSEQLRQPHSQFTDGLREYDLFHFSSACKIFSQILLENAGSVNSALFNLAGLMHMLGYPTLAVHYAALLLARTPDDMIAHTFLWNLTSAAAEGAMLGKNQDIHLLECCVRCYTHLCQRNGCLKDPTSAQRLATLGRRYLPTGVEDQEQEAASRAAHARRIYEDMGTAFESRLVDKLGYRGPWILYELISALDRCANTFPAMGTWQVLDVGCGSGLVGRVFAPFVRNDGAAQHVDTDSKAASPLYGSVYQDMQPLHEVKQFMVNNDNINKGIMIGIDISSKMCDISIETNSYDSVACCDAIAAVKTFSGEPKLLDMIVCADTLIYLGPLGAFFGACSCALRSHGLFVFSIEDLEQSSMRLNGINGIPAVMTTTASISLQEGQLDGVNIDNEDIVGAVPGWGGALLSSSRYAHSAQYITALANLHGFHIKAQESVVLRTESTVDVKGLMYVLAKYSGNTDGDS